MTITSWNLPHIAVMKQPTPREKKWRHLTKLRSTIQIFILLLFPVVAFSQPAEPLSSWMDGPTKQAIIQFVKDVTDRRCPQYVSPAERIAVFDNDGTLWPEQPMYIQMRFALDRVKALLPEHPEWKNTEPFKSAIGVDLDGLAATGLKGMLELVVGIHKFIGRRPIAEFGNSDGDFQMLEWTTSGAGSRLGVYIHHDDGNSNSTLSS